MSEDKQPGSGFEYLYHRKINRIAEKVFGWWGLELNPSVTIIGVNSGLDIVTFPDTNEIKHGWFNKIKEKVDKKIENDPQQKEVRMGPDYVFIEQQISIKNRSWKKSFEEMIFSKISSSRKSFVSDPIDKFGYKYFVCLTVDRELYNEFNLLKVGMVNTKWGDPYKVKQSVLECFCLVLLEDAVEVLALSKKHVPPVDSLDEDHCRILCQKAARNLLMSRLGYVSTYGASYRVFNDIEELSMAKYEGASIQGKIVVAQKNHDAIKDPVLFKNHVPLSDPKAARKILEMSNDELFVLCENEKFVGLCGLENKVNSCENEAIMMIEFIGHRHWVLSHFDKRVMDVKNGRPSPCTPDQSLLKIKSYIERIFSRENSDTNRLFEVCRSALNQAHGTMIIISDHAAQESDRLSVTSTSISPRFLTKDLVENLTSIDGAIIIDTFGKCHALGVILDGESSPGIGSAKRGARYNSACRYVVSSKNRGHLCMAVIVSEDGPVDIQPELRSQICKSDITSKLDRFDELEKLNPERFDLAYELNKVYFWFKEHEDYITYEQARQVNSLMEKLFPKPEPGEMPYYWEPLVGQESVDANLFVLD